jgi:hypothetical protein
MENQEVVESTGEVEETFDPVLEIKKVAENARQRIEHEFSTTANTWLDCFLTDVSLLPLIWEAKPLPPRLQEVAEKNYHALLKSSCPEGGVSNKRNHSTAGGPESSFCRS